MKSLIIISLLTFCLGAIPKRSTESFKGEDVSTMMPTNFPVFDPIPDDFKLLLTMKTPHLGLGIDYSSTLNKLMVHVFSDSFIYENSLLIDINKQTITLKFKGETCRLLDLGKYLPDKYRKKLEEANKGESGIIGILRKSLPHWSFFAKEKGEDDGYLKYGFPNLGKDENMVDLLFNQTTRKLSFVSYESLGILVYFEKLFEDIPDPTKHFQVGNIYTCPNISQQEEENLKLALNAFMNKVLPDKYKKYIPSL